MGRADVTIAFRTATGPPGSSLAHFLDFPVHRRTGMAPVVRPFDRLVVELRDAGDAGAGLPVNSATPEAAAVRLRRAGADVVESDDRVVLPDVAALLRLCEQRGQDSVALLQADRGLLPELQAGAWCETGWRTRALRRVACSLPLPAAFVARLPRLERLPPAAVGLLADLAFWLGVRRAADAAEWRRLTASYVVLLYHRISDDRKADQELIEVLPARFTRQMSLLRRLGYRTLAPDDLLAVHERAVPPAARAFVVTADDGFEDCVERLAEADIGAQVFVPTAAVGGVASAAWGHAHPSPGWAVDDEPLATWERLRDGERRGVAVGSHGQHHVALTSLSPADLREQLVAAQRELSAQLAAPLDAIAYPHGMHDRAVRDAALAAGHRAAFTTQPGRNGVGTDPGCLRRVPVYREDGTLTFLFKVLTGEDVALPTGETLSTALAVARRPSRDALLETRRGRAIVARWFGSSAGDVLQVVEGLGGAGIDCWVAGGWGIDALLGRQTRPHSDIDIAIDARLIDEGSSASALRPLGYRPLGTHSTSGVVFDRRWMFGTRRGRRVDILPIDPTRAPFGAAAFAVGSIDGHPVACLSAIG